MKRSNHNRLIETLEGRSLMSAVACGQFHNDLRPEARELPREAAVSVLALASPLASPAQTVQRTYLSAGTAQFINEANDFVGTGTATYLGRYTEAGSAQFSPTSDPTVLRVDAQSTYTAANGDELYAVFTGQLNGLTGSITATVTYVGGTGRFADASGTATLSGQLLPGGAIEVTVKGTIEY